MQRARPPVLTDPVGEPVRKHQPGVGLQRGARLRWHTLADHSGKWVVLYFYPKDDTSGCTREAQDFTALAGKFKAGYARKMYLRTGGGGPHGAPNARNDIDGGKTGTLKVWGRNLFVTAVREAVKDALMSWGLYARRLRQQVQSTPLCLGASGNVPCVENRRWTFGGVTYATLNIQGSCNNLCDSAPDPSEWAARNAADIAWLRERVG